MNGDIKEGANGAGALSEDWDGRAAFGRHDGNTETYDYFDEIDMYNRELSPLEIRQMFMKCSDVLPYGKLIPISYHTAIHLEKFSPHSFIEYFFVQV